MLELTSRNDKLRMRLSPECSDLWVFKECGLDAVSATVNRVFDCVTWEGSGFTSDMNPDFPETPLAPLIFDDGLRQVDLGKVGPKLGSYIKLSVGRLPQ